MKQINWNMAGKVMIVAAILLPLILLVGAMVVAMLIRNEWITPDLGEQIVMAMLAVVSFMLCLWCSGKIRHGRMTVCLIAAVAMMLMLLFEKTLMFADREVVLGWNIGLLFLPAIFAALVSSRRKQRK